MSGAGCQQGNRRCSMKTALNDMAGTPNLLLDFMMNGYRQTDNHPSPEKPPWENLKSATNHTHGLNRPRRPEIFTARCYACPSVTRRYSLKTVVRIIKLCPPSGRTLSYSFSVPHHMAVLWRVLPLTGVSNARGMKKRDFRRIFRFIERWRQAPYNIHPEPSPAADCTAHAGCSIGSVERQRTRNSHSSQAVPLRLQEIACLHYWQHVTLTALIQLTTYDRNFVTRQLFKDLYWHYTYIFIHLYIPQLRFVNCFYSFNDWINNQWMNY